MKKQIHLLTPVAFALFVLSPTLNAQEVLTRIGAPELHEIFRDEGYSFETDSDGHVTWKLDGNLTRVYRSEEGNSLLFRVGFKNENTTLAKVNEWNKSKQFSRSYLDDDGDPVLELDLDIDGGITKARIIDFLKSCKLSMQLWAREVLQ